MKGAGAMITKAPLSGEPSPQLDTLTEINLDDLFDAGGLSHLRRTPLQRLMRPSARRFALVAQEFDHRVREQGLAQGSSWLLHKMTAGAQVTGVEHIPASGPLVVLANHPGMTDTVALLASLASRPDLLVVALDRPFLRSLPNVAERLLFVADDDTRRMTVVRTVAKHLKQGGALLTFPAGEIEPDPAICGGHQAVESVARWSDSFVLLARWVPATRFVPAIVSNVVSAQARRHWLTWLRRTADGKERLAAALQVAMPQYQGLVARVAFGPAQQLCASGLTSLQAAIVGQVRQLIETSADAGQVDAAYEGASPGTRSHGGPVAPWLAN
ncbi:MAG TPA: 1-acyl-sn-glycerol-3-phosphate acyltransferase [Burkholderiaceae bacterium]|nr:1-acyl-sn-glycerol-3-phosphate acyltransferase [Burkholderiaceae bacterium]